MPSTKPVNLRGLSFGTLVTLAPLGEESGPAPAHILSLEGRILRVLRTESPFVVVKPFDGGHAVAVNNDLYPLLRFSRKLRSLLEEENDEPLSKSDPDDIGE